MKAVFITAIFPVEGPKIIAVYPEDLLSFDEKFELSLKCMPMGGKEGDFSSIMFKDYQVCSLLDTVVPIDKEKDPRDTIISIGFLLEKLTNPIPYRNLLNTFISECKKNNMFNLKILEKIFPRFIKLKEKKTITIPFSDSHRIKFSLKTELDEKDGLDLLDEILW
jgi:hypothetical protein